MLSLVAVASALTVVVVRSQPPARVTQPARTPARSLVASDWLASSAGRLDRSAPLARRAADLEVRLGGAGVVVRSGTTKLDVATLDVGRAGPWQKHANGIVRPTSFGRETITVGPSSTEIFLHVDRRQGKRTWSWQLGSNLRPTLIPGGSVLLRGTKPIEIRPVAIYDAGRANITPEGAHWKLTPIGKSWRLDLQLDDAKLRLPYVIDPEFQSHPSYRSIVTTDGGSLMPLDDGGTSLVQNVPSNSSHSFNGTTDQIALGSQTPPTVLEVWFSTGSTGEMPFYSNRNPGTTGDLYFGMEGGHVFAFVNGVVFLEGPQPSWADSQPHHAVFVNDGGTGHLYVDGVERASGSVAGIGGSGASPAALGHDFQNPGPHFPTDGEWFTGNLDEFATYGSALTAAQVLNHFQAGSDSTPPTLTVTGVDGNSAAVADGTRTRSDTASFTYTPGGDAVGAPQCSLDGAAFAACTASPVAVGPLSGTGSVTGDPHTFAVRVADSVGNTRTVEVDWTVDRSAPTARVAATIDPAAVTTSYVLSSNDVIGTFQCSIDGGAASACTSPVNLAGTSHTIAVTATDDVGNVQTAPPVSPPSLTSGTVPPARTNLTAFNFAFTPAGGSTVGCRTDAGAFGACTTGTTYDVSGLSGAGQTGTPHTVDIQATDATGFNSTTQHFGWTVDTTAPVLTTFTPPPAVSNSASFTFVSNETQGTSHVNCSLGLPNPPTAPCTSPKDFAPLADGTYTARFRPVDDVGNLGAVTSYTWTYDATNPTLPPLTGQDGNAVAITEGVRTSSTSASFSFSPSDANGIQSVQCRVLPAAFGACTTGTTYNVSGLAPTSPHGDSFTVEVKATDNAGNSTTVSRTWTVDNIGPTTTVQQAITTATNTATYTFAANEPSVTFQCDSGTGFAACSSPVTLTPVPATFSVKGTDDVANTGATAVPPTLAITSGPAQNAAVASSSASFGFTPGGNPALSQCKLDGGSLAGCSSPYNVTGLADGSHVVTIKTVDNAGNSTSRTRNWTVDLTGPTISFTATPAAMTTSTSAHFQFIANEMDADGSTFQCELAGFDIAFFDCHTGTVDYTGLGVGTHTFHVKVDDNLGNHSADTTYTWTIVPPSTAGGGGSGTSSPADHTPPSAPGNFRGSVQAGSLSLAWDPATDNVAIGHYLLWVDGLLQSVFGPTTFQAAIGAFAADDQRVFKLAAGDTSGNVGPFTPSLTGVPNVTGQQVEAARSTIAARGFSVGKVTDQASEQQPGTVISQAPSSPGVAAVGSGIDLVVSQQGGQAQLVIHLSAAHRVLLRQRNFIAVRVALSLPSAVKGVLRDLSGHVTATWQRQLPAGATIVRLTLPKSIRHTGVYRLRVDAAADGQSAHETIAISLVGPSKATVKPINRKRSKVQVMLVNGPDIRTDIALGLNQRFSLRYAEGTKAFDAAEGTTASTGTVAVAVVDVAPATVSVLRDLHLVFPELRIIAVADSSSTAGLAHAAGASVVFTKPISSTVLAAAIQSLSLRS